MSVKLNPKIAGHIMLGLPYDGVVGFKDESYVAFNGMQCERVDEDTLHFRLTYNGEYVADLATLNFPIGSTMTVDKVMGLLQARVS